MIKLIGKDHIGPQFQKFWGGYPGFEEVSLEHRNSPHKILVVDWWEWLRKQPGFDAGDPVQQANLSTDEIISEVKEHDICFFVSREVLYAGRPKYFDIHEKVLTDMMTELASLNVFYVTLSEDSHFSIDKSKSFNMPWFMPNHLYTSANTTIDFDYRPKDFTFNMLLGSDKDYRTDMFESIGDEKCVYSTYFGHKEYSLQSAGHLEDDDVWNNLTNQDLSMKLNTMERAIREDNSYCISHISPELIYNNSHFDIVSESNPLRETLHFTTEKTGKPLSTGRFFIWYNSPHKVEYLKQFGFELQDYLCEYDGIINNSNRMEQVCGLVKEIGDNKNYIKKIYKDTKEARIHNHEVFKELASTTRSNLSSWISRQISREK